MKMNDEAMEQQHSSQISSSMDSSEPDYSYDYEIEDVSPSPVKLKEVSNENDPEFVVYKCYKMDEVIPLLKEEIYKLSESCNIAEDEAMFFMQKYNFDVSKIAEELKKKGMELFISCKLYSRSESSMTAAAIVPATTRKDFKIGNPFKVLRSRKLSFKSKTPTPAEPPLCTICYCEGDEMRALSCGHKFCSDCWVQYFVSSLNDKDQPPNFECMDSKCEIKCLNSFVISILQVDQKASKTYMENLYRECVSCHPNYRFCPTKNCEGIIWCESKKAHKVACDYCKMEFCVQCLKEYHAPSSCQVITQWTKKCGDDSETANYIRVNTKDCPRCSSYIEKNGGCNHMKCQKCKYDFCWICLGEWTAHGESYYSCSRYSEKTVERSETAKKKARRELEKYLHYFERYDNHAKSLQLEEELRQKIIAKIEEKIENREGTWIDWQYLFDAASLLTKCRNTLQFTYPLAYYLEKGQRKELFEYQQGELEKELEELSWKVERADTTDQSDLENQMHVAECKRRTLLQDFLC